MKHSVYTTHVGPWLHRHRLVHTYTRTYIHTHTRTRIPGGPKVALVSTRESHSINTPRCLLRLHPQKPSGAPLPRRPCLFSFSFSLLSSPLSTGYPSAPWPTCSPTPGKRDDTVETGFRPAEDSERKYSAQQNFSTHAPRGLCKKRKKEKKPICGGHSRESLWRAALFPRNTASRFFPR